MKPLLVLVLLGLSTLSKAQDTTQHLLPEGTIVSVELLQAISSRSSHTGDLIDFQTTTPISVGGQVLVPVRTKVTGRITEATPRRGMGKAGKLIFSIDYLNMPSGKNIKLTGQQTTDGETKVGTAVAEAVLLTPLFLLKKGKDIDYEEGHIFKAYVEKDTAF